jgi:hypothetical protein
MGPSVFKDFTDVMDLVDEMKVSGHSNCTQGKKHHPVNFRIGLFAKRKQ